MGVKIDQFDIPVCNIFRAKLYHDQFCYEADFNQFKTDLGFLKEISVSFFIHFNEDRMLSISYDYDGKAVEQNDIIVDTIGKEILSVEPLRIFFRSH